MARKASDPAAAADEAVAPDAPRTHRRRYQWDEAAKAVFKHRLYECMVKLNMTQSELASRSGLVRDSVSKYMKGAINPSAHALIRISDVLGVDPSWLYPEHPELIARSAVAATAAKRVSEPVLELRVSDQDRTKAHLTIDRVVRLRTALKIVELIEDDDASDGS